MGVRDETAGDDGCTSISCGGPVEHTLGIEMIDGIRNTNVYGSGGRGQS